MLEKSEKCEINFVVLLINRYIRWYDEFVMKPCVVGSKNKISS